MTFSLIGLWALKVLNSVWAFPILFGVSIPIANWTDLGTKKIQKITVIGITALGLFFIGIGLSIWISNFQIHWLATMISGIVAVLFLSVNSAFIDSLKPKLWTYLLAFVLCSSAFPIGTIELLNDHIDGDIIFLFWTVLFTIGLTTGFAHKNTVSNQVDGSVSKNFVK